MYVGDLSLRNGKVGNVEHGGGTCAYCAWRGELADLKDRSYDGMKERKLVRERGLRKMKNEWRNEQD